MTQMCRGATYVSEYVAEETRRLLAEKGGPPRSMYQCGCGYWHLLEMGAPRVMPGEDVDVYNTARHAGISPKPVARAVPQRKKAGAA